MARVCWLCEKEVADGTPLKNDVVIRFIREMKRKVGILKGNELVVCSEHLAKYAEKRKKFERNLVLYATVGVLIAIGLPVLPLVAGAPFEPMTICFSVLLGGMVLALSILNYVPALETGEEKGA
ncbi:hypothetical protein H0O01_02475 [Candidatus Micrarchaeota archaeon]|nr:hypothetical protein [Candidatus Micrarchaeota archaeon]